MAYRIFVTQPGIRLLSTAETWSLNHQTAQGSSNKVFGIAAGQSKCLVMMKLPSVCRTLFRFR